MQDFKYILDPEALGHLEAKALKGDKPSCYQLGVQYACGTGFWIDTATALKWLKAAGLDDHEAQHIINGFAHNLDRQNP